MKTRSESISSSKCEFRITRSKKILLSDQNVSGLSSNIKAKKPNRKRYFEFWPFFTFSYIAECRAHFYFYRLHIRMPLEKIPRVENESETDQHSESQAADFSENNESESVTNSLPRRRYTYSYRYNFFFYEK